MTFELPTALHSAMQQRAESLGIPLDEAIRQALSFYLHGVSDTQSQSPRVGYTTQEVAKMVGLSTKTILRLVESGDITPLPHSKRRFIFSRKEVERFADSTSGEKKSPTSRKR